MKRRMTILLTIIAAALAMGPTYSDRVPPLSFQDCMTGPGVGCSGWCCTLDHDYDGDDDVDLADWQKYTIDWESWQNNED